MITGIFTFLSMTIAICWSFIFLLVSPLGIRINKVSGSRMKKFLPKVNHASIWTDGEPEGWICGKWFIGFVQVVHSERNTRQDLWIVSSKKFFEASIQQKETDDTGKSNKMTYWVREGNYFHLQYISRQQVLPARAIREKQSNVIQQIVEMYNEKHHIVCLLHGDAGGGKSMTAQYLCAELLKTNKAIHFCDTHSPCEPGDNFDSFYNKINPTDDSPLVLVFEEVDGMILNLHMAKVEQGKHIPVQIKNKTDWNCFLDKFDREIYQNVILLMTTNKSAGWFDGLDPSYMRVGRVDLKIEF